MNQRLNDHHESCVLAQSGDTPAAARRFVVSALEHWGVRDDFDDLPLVTSELVTNAVRHAASDVVVSIDLSSSCVRVEVSDVSPKVPLLGALDVAHDGGWGLHIVEQLSTRWGLEPRLPGKTVWCELARPAGLQVSSDLP